MKEKKFNFVFITTNLINEHQYVGEHSTNNKEISHTSYIRWHGDKCKN
jgi:hypothetical protein